MLVLINYILLSR